LQLASAYTAIANHGKRLPPSLLRLNSPSEGEQVIRSDVADDMLHMMDEVVSPQGIRRAVVPGYSVAGKSGTARKTGAGGYQKSSYRSLFVGITPVSDSRITSVVMIDNPKAGVWHGGAIAAPVFARLAGAAPGSLDVPPDRVREIAERDRTH